MFNWLNKQGVKSSSGYVLQRMHRFYYHYVENKKTMKIDVEPGIECEEIFLGNKWEPPNETESISLEKLEEIRSNISKAMSFMKIKHRFDAHKHIQSSLDLEHDL